MEVKGEKIIICPLSWGLGHASRMVEIAWRLKSEGKRITIAGNNETINLFKAELSGIEFINFKGFSPFISNKKWLMPFVGLFHLPYWLIIIFLEHYQIHKLLKNNSFDTVISDNRPGLFSKNVRCIYVTHQLNIETPNSLRFLKNILNKAHHFFIRKFDECWIPDSPEINLSGKLSENIYRFEKVKFIGFLSRFKIPGNLVMAAPIIDIVVIASGPEPQRSYYINTISGIARHLPYKTVIFSGKFDHDIQFIPPSVMVMPFIQAASMKNYLQNARLIICRSGYSTLMDLLALNLKALLIPTPGQSEQEYLAYHLNQNMNFPVIYQNRNFERELRSFIQTFFS